MTANTVGSIEPGKVSIVIVNWNTGALLQKCVHSALADAEQAGLTGIEIIVVDNSSSDGSTAFLASDFRSVRCIMNSENTGFASATNQGIRLSRGQYILALNPDTELRTGALVSMIRFLESHDKAGAVGPMLINSDGSLQISAYPEPTVLREGCRLLYLDKIYAVGSYPMRSWKTDAAREVDVLTGACLLLRRDVLDQCGLFDERYFIYSEDQDICGRIRAKGWRLFWVPQARVVHHGGRSTSQAKGEMFLRLYREKIAYFKAHHGQAVAARYKVVLFVASIVRLILSPLVMLAGGVHRRRALESARYYRQLVRELPEL